jgi:uracil-DNA glycosylase family 4
VKRQEGLLPQLAAGDEPYRPIAYDPNCRACPRLARFLDAVKAEHPSYFCKPVPPFGDGSARLLIVGLAPGLHGANATGRPFTGDWCGPLLYGSLHRYGFASKAQSLDRNDGLELIGCRISNAVKCLPPQNKPELAEIRRCNTYLAAELRNSPELRTILALGAVAHLAVVEACGLKTRDYKFAHGARHRLPPKTSGASSALGLDLFDSYHVSRYNTNTGRLTEAMFHAVLQRIRSVLD